MHDLLLDLLCTIFPYDKCGKQVPNDKQAMMLHMSRAHNENSVKDIPGPTKPNKTPNQCFECESCDFKGCSKPSLIRHMAMIHSSAVKINVAKYDRKSKLPEKKEKCNICGRMLLNLKGLDLHKKRMHMIKENNSRKQIIQSDSVKSLASPPPKKHEKDSKPKENPKKKELQANKHEKDSKPEGRGVRGGVLIM